LKKIAIIPARGGSKRIPKKNIKNFMGSPVISYAIKTALNCNLFDIVMVSTDCKEIGEIAKKYGAKVPFFRTEKNSDDFAILSFSVTPWIDSVQKLKSFVKDNEIKMKNWYFLTGQKSKIYELARKSYFAEESLGFTKDSTDFLHTEHVLLVDKNFKIRGIYNSTLSLEIKNLSADIDILLKNK